MLPLDIVPLDVLFMFDEPPMPVLLEPELLMPLELVEPVVEGEPLAGCERSPCDRLELGGVVVLLEVPLVPIEEPLVPIVVPVVLVPVVEPDC